MYKTLKNAKIYATDSRVADPKRFNSDPGPTFDIDFYELWGQPKFFI